MYCPRCGAQNADGSLRCASCGFELQSVAAPTAPAATTAASGIEVLIPYKNTAALTAYYLGVFSIVCGLILGPPALILGIMGVKYANQHLEARGKVHAWVGITLGSLMTLINVTLIVSVIFAAVQH